MHVERSEIFNGTEGAKNSKGEPVRFQFNVTGMEVQNTNSAGTSAREIAFQNGISGGEPKYPGGPDVAPAAIVTTESTTQSQTTGYTIRVDDTPGATAHEVGHTLMTRDQRGEESAPGSGGLMVDPPSFIKPAEVDKMLQDAIQKKQTKTNE